MRVDQITPEQSLERARTIFEETKDLVANNSIGARTRRNHVGFIRGWLKRANADVSALDPTGVKSAVDIEAELDKLGDLTKAQYIARAREEFAEFERGASVVPKVPKGGVLHGRPAEDRFERIHFDLEAAGVDWSILDPTGKRSTEEIRDTLLGAQQKELDSQRVERSDGKDWKDSLGDRNGRSLPR